MAKLTNPIYNIEAIDKPEAPPEYQDSLSLCVGAKVMLTQNIWKKAGLVNNATGTVVDVVYDDDGKKDGKGASNMPTYVLVIFDVYLGPKMKCRDDMAIPIVPVVSSEYCPIIQHRWMRTMIPLRVSYGGTIHRCQGLTLPKIVIVIEDLPSAETNPLFSRSSPTLFFVALSRVRRLSDIAFTGRVPDTFMEPTDHQTIMRWMWEEERLSRFHIQSFD
jgi:ATP-dependent exoDNAse (exonuclease V) alpha subunit